MYVGVCVFNVFFDVLFGFLGRDWWRLKRLKCEFWEIQSPSFEQRILFLQIFTTTTTGTSSARASGVYIKLYIIYGNGHRSFLNEIGDGDNLWSQLSCLHEPLRRASLRVHSHWPLVGGESLDERVHYCTRYCKFMFLYTHTHTYMNIYAVLEFWGQLWILNRLSRIMCLTKVYVLMWVVDIHTYTYNNDNNNKGSVLKLWGAQETMQDWNYVGIYVNVYV